MNRSLAKQIEPTQGFHGLQTDYNLLNFAGLQQTLSPDAVGCEAPAAAASIPVDAETGNPLALPFASVQSGSFDDPAGHPPALGGLSKRALDVLVALAGLVAMLPFLALVWLVIRVSTGGPALFVQQRVGLGGRMFPCFKFRTMAPNADALLHHYLATRSDAAAEWRATQKLMDDPRVTRLGRVLRKTSIDELPQLINVLRGEMSCVGPRPILPEELARYGRNADDYLRTRPGLTGMWQVSGRSKLSYDDRVALDSSYVNQWSMLLDLKILMKTIVVLAKIDETA